MTTPSDTPRTDAAVGDIQEMCESHLIRGARMVIFARQLERELKAAREELNRMGWQPIETVPVRIAVDVWDGTRRWPHCTFRPGWSWPFEQKPTHWMPIPNPPKELCESCGGSGMTPGWVPSYSNPDNSGGDVPAEPCDCEAGRRLFP